VERVNAAQVINAGGPFSDEVRAMSDAHAPKMIMASSGVHVSLPDYYSPDHLGMIVPKTKARAPPVAAQWVLCPASALVQP
jgi:glycerol-3-phosphate dehydrogenase